MKRRRKTKLPNPHNLSPDFLSKDKEAQLRTHKVVVRFNDHELKALKRYQELLKGKSKSAACREAIMEKVISVLEDHQPTLF